MREIIQFNQLSYELKECFKEVFPSLKDESKIHLEKKGSRYCFSYLKSNRTIRVLNCNTLRIKKNFKELLSFLTNIKVKEEMIDIIKNYYEAIVDNTLKDYVIDNQQSIIRCNRYLQRYNNQIVKFILEYNDYYLFNDDKPHLYTYGELVSHLLSTKPKSSYLLVGSFSLDCYASNLEYEKKYCVLRRQNI